MTKIDKYIEIVGSNKPRLNAMAKSSRQDVLEILRRRYLRVEITMVDTMADLDELVAKRPDLVVLGVKTVPLDLTKSYKDSPKLWLSAYLKQHGIDFTGSEAEALATEFDKPVAKQKVLDAGLRTAAYFTSTIERPTFRHELTFPLFVKPISKGGSKGVDEKSVVYSQAELESKVTSIHQDYLSDALVEEYLSGREFSVAVVRQPLTGALRAMPIEIQAPSDKQGNSFLSEAVKKADSEKVIAVSDPILRARVDSLAIGVFKALGSRDYGRIDMRMDASGAPNFMEANLMPGLSNHGYLARCFFINEHISYEDMILTIVNLGLSNKVLPLGVGSEKVKMPLKSAVIV